MIEPIPPEYLTACTQIQGSHDQHLAKAIGSSQKPDPRRNTHTYADWSVAEAGVRNRVSSYRPISSEGKISCHPGRSQRVSITIPINHVRRLFSLTYLEIEERQVRLVRDQSSSGRAN